MTGKQRRRIATVAVWLGLLGAWAGTGWTEEPVQALLPKHLAWHTHAKIEAQQTQLAGEATQLAGFQLGPSLDRRLYLGLGGYTLVNTVDAGTSGFNDLKPLDFWAIGASAEYTFLSKKAVHGSVGCFAGVGRLGLSHQVFGTTNSVTATGETVVEITVDTVPDDTSVFTLEPGVNLLVNLTRTVEAGLGLRYRYVSGSDRAGFADADLTDSALTLVVRWTEGE